MNKVLKQQYIRAGINMHMKAIENDNNNVKAMNNECRSKH